MNFSMTYQSADMSEDLGGVTDAALSANLIDALIATLPKWDKYEDCYMAQVRRIVAGDSLQGSAVADIAELLRAQLTPAELNQLPQMVASRRAGQILVIQSDIEHGERRHKELLARRREEERQEREREERRRQEELARNSEEERLRREQEEAAERARLERELRARKQAFADRAPSAFESDFLSADEQLQADPDREALSDAEYLELKSRFARAWAQRELQQTLDEEQGAAVASTGGDIKVVARAGAGKTRTLVTRALFFQRHCGVAPDELLLLAFNAAAAQEMRGRLEEVLGRELPHVMTFHALAYALVHPEEELVFDEPSAGSLGLSREIQRVIDEHLQSERYRPLIRDLMLMHFREDWERIVEGGFHLAIDELIAYRSSLPRETLRGEYVKSFGERLIANTLFENDIDYRYERNFRWSGVNYKPDFTIPVTDRRGVVIEYFGLRDDPDYDKMSQEKRRFWARRAEWTFLEFSPEDIRSNGVEAFANLLLERLARAGVEGGRLSEEEIWQRIRRRAVDRFTGAMRSFVGRCRKRNLTSEALQDAIGRHVPITEAEGLFLTVGASVHSEYLRRLATHHQDDFDGLMWRAVDCVRQGRSRFVRDKGRERGDLKRIRFVLIDEFQDFSGMFDALAQGIRALSPRTEFFCVGDDWQAINGFAGSDLRFFEDFAAHFRDTTTLHVSTNYRSPPEVVRVGNALMAGKGKPANAQRSDCGYVRTARLGEFAPTASEQARHNGDEATPALLRLVRRLLDDGRDVVMLSRRNGVPWFVSYAPGLRSELDGLQRFAEHVRSFLPADDRGRVTASTAHKYKGLENEAVIVLDADEGCYPLVHPNWVFLRVFGDSVAGIEAEERRLFYVALTRSRHSLVVLSDHKDRESQYLSDIRSQTTMDALDWPTLPPMPSLDGARVEVRVSFPYDTLLNERLKNLRYRWNDPGKFWCRSTMAEDFDFDALCGQPWVRTGVCIEVYSEDGDLLKRHQGGD